MFEKIYLDDDQVILESKGCSSSDVDAFLKGLGCEKPDALDRIGTQIFLLDSSAWKGKYVPFFTSANSLWFGLRARDVEPEHYFVVGIDEGEMSALRLRLRLYFSLRSILKGLCHQEGDDLQPMKYVFFISKESYLTRLEVLYAMSLDELLAIEVEPLELNKAEILRNAVLQEDDVHCDERKHVMREALVEFFKEERNRTIEFFMSGVLSFYSSYTERYKVYVSKFSVNKIISEIESERIGFLCKVQDAIMSQQTKAFAIPGGLIAVGAILKVSNDLWEIALVFIGFAISTWMVASLNRDVVEHIGLLGSEFKRSISKYDDVVVGIEDVRAEIEYSSRRLNVASASAKSKLRTLTAVSWVILVVVAFVFMFRSGVVRDFDFEFFFRVLGSKFVDLKGW
ncbi:hypothetical protein KW851_02630 [Pseudomonas sp. PDM33]|uniref:hypothetical protein n=1 Tax=Pseudomonas sp. PDM33 TaxID=2854765 RepID=UPI001C4387D3|nr:hypothetical protein [Pseudomonas sp. PDM33]MBV7581696.1 hypothetical protein [Pseudomonas sp. PDM33]